MIGADAGHFLNEKDPRFGHSHVILLSHGVDDISGVLGCCGWINHRDGNGMALLIIFVLEYGFNITDIGGTIILRKPC